MQATEKTDSTLTMDLTPRQSEAWELIERDDVREVLFGGAKGGGKSVFLCYWCYFRAVWIIHKFGLERRKHPIPVGWMGRLQGVDFANTTLETWKRVIPPDCYEIKEQAREIVIGSTVKIDFGGLDNRETVNKFNSAEYNFFAIDQAEEVSLDDVSVLRGTRRLKINDQAIPAKGLFTANPAQCWLKSEFIENPSPEKRYIQALPSDNPYLPDEYIGILEEAFKHRQELLEAYLHGSWDALEGADQVIKDVWIREAAKNKFHNCQPSKLLVFDPARFGDDETVIYVMDGTDIVEEKVLGQKDGMYIANVVHIMAVEHRVSVVGGDSIGIGGPILDRLREMSDGAYQVRDIDSAERQKSGVPARYYNRRAEMWDVASKLFASGDVELHHEDSVLRSQLRTPRYEFRNGKILIESKEKIKDRLGRSPDRADAYVMGLYLGRDRPPAEPLNLRRKRLARQRHRENLKLTWMSA